MKIVGLGIGAHKPYMRLITLPETNSSHLKMDGWNISFHFQIAHFQVRTVSFREGIIIGLIYSKYLQF